MLKSITLENFFSFGEATKIELNKGVNVLIGINGSGKSNLLKAIQLLYEGLVGKGLEKLFLGDWGGFDNVYNQSEANKTGFIRLVYEFGGDNYLETNDSYCLEIYKFSTFSYYISEAFVNNRLQKVYFEINSGVGTNNVTKEKINYSSTELYAKTRAFAYPIANYLRYYSNFNTAIKGTLRIPSDFSTEKFLLPNGENYPHLLNYIVANHGRYFDKIEKALAEVNPNFKSIVILNLSSKLLLTLREKNLNKTTPIEHISDGTLRYLLLLSIFLNPDGGSLISIDEPEVGLHPDMIQGVATMMKECAQSFGTQIFVATHSPLLLDAFQPNEVLIFAKDNETNNTKIVQKTPEELKRWASDYTLGQMWLDGKLGGVRW